MGQESRCFNDDADILREIRFLPHLLVIDIDHAAVRLQKSADTFHQDSFPGAIVAYKQVGLDPDMKKPVGKYSLGMRQRLGFAQALMEDPSLLILDEPFNGLDKHGVIHIRNVIKGLREEGKTVILASHNQVDIDELCDTVCEMDAGVLTVVR